MSMSGTSTTFRPRARSCSTALCLGDEDAKVAQNVKFRSLGELNNFVHARFAERESVFVLARGLRIWRWSRASVETSNEDGLVQAATEVLKNIKGLLEQESTREPSSNVPFRAALAGVEATAEELVDA